MKVLFAYIPVVHSGTLAFLDEHRDMPVWILDNEWGKTEYVYLERDMRALSAHDIEKELKAHGVERVRVVDGAKLQEAAPSLTEIVAPHDEAVSFFLEKYCPSVPVTYKNVFLRWTKQISTTEFVVPPDRTISREAFDREVMIRLNQIKDQSPDWWRQIAGALVKNGEVVETAFNTHHPSAHALTINGDPRSNLDAGQGPGIYTSIHAEASLVAQCAQKGVSVEGSDVYVTTFPCPSCARLLVEAGVQRVFYEKGYSLLDAETILKNAGIEIILVTE